jgi:hypothetical protein
MGKDSPFCFQKTLIKTLPRQGKSKKALDFQHALPVSGQKQA